MKTWQGNSQPLLALDNSPQWSLSRGLRVAVCSSLQIISSLSEQFTTGYGDKTWNVKPPCKVLYPCKMLPLYEHVWTCMGHMASIKRNWVRSDFFQKGRVKWNSGLKKLQFKQKAKLIKQLEENWAQDFDGKWNKKDLPNSETWFWGESVIIIL